MIRFDALLVPEKLTTRMEFVKHWPILLNSIRFDAEINFCQYKICWALNTLDLSACRPRFKSTKKAAWTEVDEACCSSVLVSRVCFQASKIVALADESIEIGVEFRVILEVTRVLWIWRISRAKVEFQSILMRSSERKESSHYHELEMLFREARLGELTV